MCSLGEKDFSPENIKRIAPTYAVHAPDKVVQTLGIRIGYYCHCCEFSNINSVYS